MKDKTSEQPDVFVLGNVVRSSRNLRNLNVLGAARMTTFLLASATIEREPGSLLAGGRVFGVKRTMHSALSAKPQATFAKRILGPSEGLNSHVRISAATQEFKLAAAA